MPEGEGTYGKKVGRPSKKTKKLSSIRMKAPSAQVLAKKIAKKRIQKKKK